MALDAQHIAFEIEQIIPQIACGLREDVEDALHASAESTERGREVLGHLIENSRIAREQSLPLCQDTGVVWIWIEIGEQECIPEGLEDSIQHAVGRAYTQAHLRASVVRDSLFDRTNTQDNTPAFIDISLRPGEGATIHVMLKGGGSDNASRVVMLPPSAGREGVKQVVLGTVREKASSACPPLIIGVGVGSTFDKVASLAKKALLRPLTLPAPSEQHAQFESELLDAINELGIGPGGLGGDTTALAVHINTAPSHIAALPVAVNVGCSAMRSATIEVSA